MSLENSPDNDLPALYLLASVYAELGARKCNTELINKAINRYREILLLQESTSSKRRMVLQRSQRGGKISPRQLSPRFAAAERRMSLNASMVQSPVRFRRNSVAIGSAGTQRISPRSPRESPPMSPKSPLSASLEALVQLYRGPRFHSDVTIRMGEAYFRMYKFTQDSSHFDQAKEWTEKAIADNPNDSHFHHIHAQARFSYLCKRSHIGRF